MAVKKHNRKSLIVREAEANWERLGFQVTGVRAAAVTSSV